MLMDEEGLTEDFIKALSDRYSSWELAELLDIPIRDLIEAFETLVEDYYDDLCDEIGYRGFDGSEDD